jgi:ParB family transcriptional regulator, chromosome partitioning protein
MSLQLDDLAALDAPTPGSNGQPLMLPLDSIDEDPDQPRHEFDPVALQELADSIGQRGVLQAISVRPHPQQPQRWMVNMGARRLRASRMAGKPVVPAFVDAAADSYDQIIENEQREGLKPLELALFIQKRLADGESQSDIARQMGKSRAYLTYATALIGAPDWLMSTYREGRCRGLRELYELRRLHDAAPRTVEDWLRTMPAVTRTELIALKQLVQLERPTSPSAPPASLQAAAPPSAPRSVPSSPVACLESHSARPHRLLTSKALPTVQPARPDCLDLGLTLWGNYDGAEVAIDLSGVPDGEGQVYVLRTGDARRMSVSAAQIQLRRVARAQGT